MLGMQILQISENFDIYPGLKELISKSKEKNSHKTVFLIKSN